MITQAIIRSTFRIKCNECYGTCFVINYNNKQYLITAKHVGSKWNGAGFEIFHDGKWKFLKAALVGQTADPVDISVFSPSVQLIGPEHIPASEGQMFLGQDMYFLGFPYGLSTDAGDLNQRFPVPLVKKCCFSGTGPEKGLLYFDGMNNPGFSGGPVVYIRNRRTEIKDGKRVPVIDFQYAAVISGYRNSVDSVVRTPVDPSKIISLGNSGIIITYSTNEAINLIKSNEIGFNLDK